MITMCLASAISNQLEIPDVEPTSITFLYALVMVLREMNTTSTFRIYRNGVQQAALEATFSADGWSIPLFLADFLPFTSQIFEHTRNHRAHTSPEADCVKTRDENLSYLFSLEKYPTLL